MIKGLEKLMNSIKMQSAMITKWDKYCKGWAR
ncbi:hypothetical protein J2Z72_000317 [Peptostreptococcus canis]|nr:hypothetical protein [Peptostreptococcus canis]